MREIKLTPFLPRCFVDDKAGMAIADIVRFNQGMFPEIQTMDLVNISAAWKEELLTRMSAHVAHVKLGQPANDCFDCMRDKS